ncbi:hypothetical protein BKA62DRAFT_759440 [Auriculariales sp. MPI-PUGE-AT-0066]|nr:hypothetical protein BKA62DRAFT_759440 [Auriculariales sp. MPI-PUGE-AT-0066]
MSFPQKPGSSSQRSNRMPHALYNQPNHHYASPPQHHMPPVPSRAPSLTHPYGYSMMPYSTPAAPTVITSTTPHATPSSQTSPLSPLSSSEARAPRAIPLHRGEACMHCRKRKMKCDAAKPSCGPCSRNGNECEYEISPYLRQIQQLEAEAVHLRSRIAELEARPPPAPAAPMQGHPQQGYPGAYPPYTPY